LKDSITESLAQEPRSVQINLATCHVGQFILHAKELESRDASRFKLHEHIYVAIRPEVVPQYRPKQREARDVMSPAKFRNSFFRDVEA
jgi:hypothetical protein